MKTTSKWIVELGELESTLRRDLPTLKAFLTNTDDELRVPYARGLRKSKRRTVFAGTVNKIEFLNDETGNDRFWCIPCIEVRDISHIDKQQLWAEFAECYKHGDKWWLSAEESEKLSGSNEKHQSSTVEADLMDRGLNWDADEEEWTLRTVTEVLKDLMGMVPTQASVVKGGQYLRSVRGLEMRHTSKARLYLLPPEKSGVLVSKYGLKGGY